MRFSFLGCTLLLAACADTNSARDAAADVHDATLDVADTTADVPEDRSVTDAPAIDAGNLDSTLPDIPVLDTGTLDVGVPDSGTPDSGTPDSGTPDSGTPDSGTPDSGTPDAGCSPVVLLQGGVDIASQGWTTTSLMPFTLSYSGMDTLLATSTTAPLVSGVLLLVKRDTTRLVPPFRLQVVMKLDAVARHNLSDSAAAIMGAFTPLFGTPTERSQMIYLDSDAIGFADDTRTFRMPLRDGAFHTYELSVNAAGTADVSVDGTVRLSRTNFYTNGTIAIGDQSNESMLDSQLRIRSVTLLCP